MERECKRCGRTYRGLVCHACHPRTTRKRDAGPRITEAFAQASGLTSVDAQRIGAELASANLSQDVSAIVDADRLAELIRCEQTQAGNEGDRDATGTV